MSLTGVNVNGEAVRCADLEAVVMHGRGKVTDGPTASSASVTIYDPAMPTWTVGDMLEVFTHGRVRFTGTITDVALAGHVNLGGVFQVEATGRVATLGYRDVGDTPWPEHTPRERAEAILSLAGVPFTVADISSLRVNARDVDRRDALSLITELAQDTGAAVFDTPEGTVVFQHYSTRAQTWQWLRWMDATGTWQAQTVTWPETEVVSPGAALPLSVDGCVVEWEPDWKSDSGSVVNSVTVAYGPEVQGGARPTVTATNPASVAVYGRRHVSGPKDLADEASARERATMILDLHSWPHWAIDGVTVLLDRAADPGPLLDLRCGSKVQLEQMPQPAPSFAPLKIVEGWTHTLGAKVDRLELRLSDPAHSYAGVSWGAAPTALRWEQLAADVLWANVIKDSDLRVAA